MVELILVCNTSFVLSTLGLIDVAEEFVAAGDFLTYKFPVWTWSVTTFPLCSPPNALTTLTGRKPTQGRRATSCQPTSST